MGTYVWRSLRGVGGKDANPPNINVTGLTEANSCDDLQDPHAIHEVCVMAPLCTSVKHHSVHFITHQSFAFY